MKADAGRSFDVFEFKEDELPDIVPRKFLGRLRNAAAEGDDAILKYKYLGFVSNQMSLENKLSNDVEFVDVDSVDTDRDYDCACPTMGKVRETDDAIVRPSESEQCKRGVLVQKRILAVHGSPSFCQDQDTTTSGCSESYNENLQIIHDTIFSEEDQIIDAVESDSEEMISNSSDADLISDYSVNNDYFDGYTSDPCSGNKEMPNGEIILHPDLFMLQDKYIWDAEMCFSRSSIQVTDLSARGGCATRFEWSIDNIVTIETRWHERVQTAVVSIHMLSDHSSASDPSGIREINFTVSETNWIKELESIMSLDDKYKPLCVWNDAQPCPNQTLNERLYYPEFNGSFDELVYPKDDSDPVTVSKRDIDLLQPETFINDTIIDFYVKYLKDRLQPEKVHKFHFFNSFFFRKLADLERSHFDASEGRTSFLRVRKWTRKVNLFNKEYIFIPVNSNLHWSLIVICHPGEIAIFEDNDLKGKSKVPCILHMDSIKGSHTGLKNHVQSYLWGEWKEKQNEATEEIAYKFFNLRFISLEVPQQENSYDCGLFLLHYVELFLEEAPESFNPFQITKYSNFLNASWFSPGDVSLKRAHIQRIIYSMNMNCVPTQQRCPPDSNDQICYQKFPESNNESGAEPELLSESIPLESCSGDVLCKASQDAELATLGSPSVRNHLLDDDSSMDLMEFHIQATANGLPNVADRDLNLKSSTSQSKSYTASLEESAGNDGHFLYSLASGAECNAQCNQNSLQSEDCRMQISSTELNCTRTWIEATESEDLVTAGVTGGRQMKDGMVPFLEDGDNHHVESLYLTKHIDNLSETICCPSHMVLEAASIKMSDDCSQQIDNCYMTDNPKDMSPFSCEEQNEGTTIEDQNANVNMLSQMSCGFLKEPGLKLLMQSSI